MSAQLLKIHRLRTSNAMVLILALWILSILAVFVVAIGVGIRQKIFLVSRLEKREASYFIAKAGIQTARMFLQSIGNGKGERETADEKMLKHNNPDTFMKIVLDEGWVEISYQNYDHGTLSPVRMYGLEDEAGKINVNTASREELMRLFISVAGLNEELATDIASAIISWRAAGDQEILGFYGDDYYRGLNFPYEPKKDPFERMEEILLVKGMNPEIFSRAEDFLTIYGDGKVNINTASMPVLLALGITPAVAEIIIKGRSGKDGLPSTEDDFIFVDSGVSMGIGGLVLKPDQLAEIDQLYVQNKLSAVSHLFKAKAKAHLIDQKESRFIDCVLNMDDGTMLAWRTF
jgi:type II secretory pathway component PulK